MLKVTALIPGFSSTSPECSRLIPAGLAKNPFRTRIFPHLHQGMALGSTQITQIQGNLPQLLLQILRDPPNPGCSSRRAHPIPPREDKNNPKPPTHFGSQALLVIPRSRGSWGGRSVGCGVPSLPQAWSHHSQWENSLGNTETLPGQRCRWRKG